MSRTILAKARSRLCAAQLALAGGALAAVSLAQAAGPSRYTVTDLAQGFYPQAVNAAGEVAGFSFSDAGPSSVTATELDQAGLHALGTIDGMVSRAVALNTAGVLVGSSTVTSDAYGPVHAVMYSQGHVVDLGTQLYGVDYGISHATGINKQGVVAGTVGDFDMSQDTRRAFVYQQGAMVGIGSLGGPSFANGINNLGMVTGGSLLSESFYAPPHAFIYQGGQMTDLGTLGGLASTGQAINDAGQVTGFSGFDDEAYPSAASHAFLYSQGQMKDLGTLAGDLSSFGLGINGAGMVVGSSQAMDGTEHAFLYRDGQMVDLNSYLAGTGHATLARAYGINDKGVIVGVDSNGRGFMLNPEAVPEPEVPVLALGGLVVAGAATRRRQQQGRAGAC